MASEVLRTLRAILHTVTQDARALARESGLTLPQITVLRQLATREDGEASAVALAQHAQVSSPTLTGIIDRLQRERLVERIRGTSDRRKVYVRLTPLGRERIESLAEQRQDRFVAGIEALDPAARETLLTSLQQVLALMSPPRDFEPAPYLVANEDLASDEPSE